MITFALWLALSAPNYIQQPVVPASIEQEFFPGFQTMPNAVPLETDQIEGA